MECFRLLIARTLYNTVQIPRKVVSAEPNIAFHSAGTFVHDSNVFVNGPLKSQVALCTYIGDMKKSVILCDFS